MMLDITKKPTICCLDRELLCGDLAPPSFFKTFSVVCSKSVHVADNEVDITCGSATDKDIPLVFIRAAAVVTYYICN